MTKQEIVRRFERETNGQAFITATQFTRLIGQKNSFRVKKEYLDGLDAVDGVMYFIPDVASRMMERIK